MEYESRNGYSIAEQLLVLGAAGALLVMGLYKYPEIRQKQLQQKRIEYKIPTLERGSDPQNLSGEQYYYMDGNRKVSVEINGVPVRK